MESSQGRLNSLVRRINAGKRPEAEGHARERPNTHQLTCLTLFRLRSVRRVCFNGHPKHSTLYFPTIHGQGCAHPREQRTDIGPTCIFP